MFPFCMNDHFVLLYGDVNNGLFYILDPHGPDGDLFTKQERTHFLHTYEDLWAYHMDRLEAPRKVWRFATRRQVRQVYEDFQLPLQPGGWDANCGPLTALYAATISTGKPFDYAGFEEHKEAFMSIQDHASGHWIEFMRRFRWRMAYDMAQYIDNYERTMQE